MFAYAICVCVCVCVFLTGKALTARYVWSVTPSLIAWPLPLMQTGPASIAAAGILVSMLLLS